METAWQNIILFAGVVNLVAVILCATGKLGPIGAAFTHQLSSFFVMMNSLRLLRVERATGARRASARLLGAIAAAASLGAARVTAADFGDRSRAASAGSSSAASSLARPALYAAAALCGAERRSTCCSPNETGVIERFGRKVLPYAEPGLHYKLPWPIDRLTRIQAHSGCAWSRSASARIPPRPTPSRPPTNGTCSIAPDASSASRKSRSC